MSDLLGSILGSMEAPPSINTDQRKKIKAQRAHLEKLQQKEQQRLDAFRKKMQVKINTFVGSGDEKLTMETMDANLRAIVHEIAEVAGLASFSFGEEEIDRHVVLWKKEFAPCDEELAALRKGEKWDPEEAKRAAKHRAELLAEDAASAKKKEARPVNNYRDKYQHLIGTTAAKDAARSTTAVNRDYGLVSSENKRDQRTIEQVMADTRARKKQKTADHSSSAP